MLRVALLALLAYPTMVTAEENLNSPEPQMASVISYGPIAPERLKAKQLMDEARDHLEKQNYAEAIALIEEVNEIKLAPEAPERDEARALARTTQARLMTDMTER